MGKPKSKIPMKKDKTLLAIFNYFHNHIQAINGSKIFAGVMIITLNIVSKFVNIKLGKTLEGYLKYSFSKQLLVFTIAWMGTRDIYIAFFVTCCFVIVTEYLFHEDSSFFVLSPTLRDHYINLLETNEAVTEEDVKQAKAVLEKAEKQKQNINNNNNNNDNNNNNNNNNRQHVRNTLDIIDNSIDMIDVYNNPNPNMDDRDALIQGMGFSSNTNENFHGIRNNPEPFSFR
jgi:hypothetical protein